MPTFVTNRVLDPTTGLRPWQRITANYTAQIGDRIYADTTSGSIQINLPNNVERFNEITFADLKYTWGVNSLEINPGSKKIENFNEPLICDISGIEFKLRYEGEDLGWRIIANSGGGGGGGGGGASLTPTVGGSTMGPAFHARPGSQFFITTGTRVVFDTVRFNSGNCYNTTTGLFTPNVAGFYQINATLRTSGAAGGVHLYIRKNGVNMASGSYPGDANPTNPASAISTIVEANGTTDTIELFAFTGSTGANVNSALDQSSFSGSLINFTNNYVPVGTIISYADDGPTIPDGWLVCNGANLPIANYQNLYNVIGTTYNAAPPSGQFTLPDLRGEFVRGWDGGRGIDSGRGFGTFQVATSIYNEYGNFRQPANAGVADGENSYTVNGVVVQVASATLPTVNRTWTQVRPRNVAMQYIIKY